MITAKEARQSIVLSDAEKTELERIEKSVETSIFPDRKWDGLARRFEIYLSETAAPTGSIYIDPSMLASAQRLASIFKYRREDDGWIASIFPDSDAYGNLVGFVFFLEPSPRHNETAPQTSVKQISSSSMPAGRVDPWFGEDFALPARPLLSVIFGTYNRADHLRKAVASIRRSARKLDYEIVVCDGGSTDGSREWLAAQSDIILVGERRLDGAVKAFNQCYAVCRGEFIANLNDDCVVQGEALSSGVRYLQERPKVGQVAFGFRGEGEDWHINEIYEPAKWPVTWPTTYANFGIIRKTVAEKIVAITGGFWNPVYKTYAADCELSAWVWKLGYRVDRLPHLRVLDTRADDALRNTNNKTSGLEAKRMYARWPAEAFREKGPDPRVSKDELARYYAIRDGKAASAPEKTEEDVLTQVVEMIGWPAPEEERRLRKVAPLLAALDPVDGQFPQRAPLKTTERVLHVSLCTDADPQAGLVRALKTLGGGGYKEVRWYADFGSDPVARQSAIVSAAMDLKPTIVFMQLQAKNAVEPDTIRQLRTISDLQGTNCVIATFSGDVADVNSPWAVDWQAEIGRLVDINFHASLSHVYAMRAAGIHNACFLNIGIDPLQYHEP